METRRSLFRRVLRALYIMHPALRKGPPFLQKNTPYFSFFHKKHRPISFPAYGPVPPLLENRHGTISRTICTTVGSASACCCCCCCCWVSVSPFTQWRHVTSRTASPTTIASYRRDIVVVSCNILPGTSVLRGILKKYANRMNTKYAEIWYRIP